MEYCTNKQIVMGSSLFQKDKHCCLKDCLQCRVTLSPWGPLPPSTTPWPLQEHPLFPILQTVRSPSSGCAVPPSSAWPRESPALCGFMDVEWDLLPACIFRNSKMGNGSPSRTWFDFIFYHPFIQQTVFRNSVCVGHSPGRMNKVCLWT